MMLLFWVEVYMQRMRGVEVGLVGVRSTQGRRTGTLKGAALRRSSSRWRAAVFLVASRAEMVAVMWSIDRSFF